MFSDGAGRPWYGIAIRVLGVALAYWVTGKLGLLLAIPPGYATAVWPASGIALAALIILGPRYWPGVWLGSFLINVAVPLADIGSIASLKSAAIGGAIGLGAAAQAVAGSILVRRHLGERPLLINARDIFKFLLLGGPLACLIAASWGVASLTTVGAIPIAGAAYSWFTWWVGDTIGVLIFAPLTLMWCDRSGSWLSRRWSVTLPLAMTFIAAILLFLYTSRSEWRALQADFDEDSTQITRAFSRRLELHDLNLRSIASFLASSDRVTREEFERYTRFMLDDRPDLLALGWVPRVERNDRRAFESQLPDDAAEPYIYEAPTGEPIKAPESSDYLPVEYVVSRQPFNAAGLDLGAEESRRRTFDLAIDRGGLTASPPLTLMRSLGTSRDGFYLVMPIYRTHETPLQGARRELIRGFAVGFFRVNDFALLGDVEEIAKQRVQFVIRDVSDRTRPHEVFRHLATTRAAANLDLSSITRIDIGGRTWELEFKPTLDYVAGNTALIVWLVLVGGLLFSALVGAGALVITGRTHEVEELVRTRTDELAIINEKLSLEVCDHIRTEAELKDERAFLETVLDNLREGVIVLGMDNTMTLTNVGARRTLARITGRVDDIDELDDRMEVYQPDGTPVPLEMLPRSRALNGETVVDFEVMASVAGRTPVALTITARPLLASSGVQSGALLFIRDITESRAAERLKREFISVVSHELRTPLTSIRGSLGLIKSGAVGELPEKAGQMVAIAYRNCERLSLLINDILDIDKIESGHLALEVKSLSLPVLVHQAMEANAGYGREHDVSFILHQGLPEGEVMPVRADEHRLLQVLANLLSNAAKFSPRGGNVEISIESAGRNVRVSVRDHGPGVPAEFQSRIFQKFSQADASDSRAKTGTGLGLAISKALIERMGGTIGYSTQSGAGTTFYFELPLAQIPAGVTA